MDKNLAMAEEKSLVVVAPSKRDVLQKNKVAYAASIIMKRFIDICAGFAGMCILIPLTIVLYIVKILDRDKGPLFFSQDRIGKDGKLFRMYKFRTMIVGADEELERILKTDKAARKEYEKNKKLKDDPRITKVGKFLRSTSLDEFPQFINVLKGEMSLVGPRPYLPREEEDMGYYYYYITKCKPGITGLWQVSGRSELSFEERLDLDLEYYRDVAGVVSELGLVVKTVEKTLKKEGAA